MGKKKKPKRLKTVIESSDSDSTSSDDLKKCTILEEIDFQRENNV